MDNTLTTAEMVTELIKDKDKKFIRYNDSDFIVGVNKFGYIEYNVHDFCNIFAIYLYRGDLWIELK